MPKESVLHEGPGSTTGKRTTTRVRRRQQLIDATIDCIRKHGISGTTMGRITGLAGLSVGQANFYFETKEKLLEETLRFLAEEHHAHWKAGYEKADLSPQTKLRAIAASHFHPHICSRKKIATWYGFFGEAGSRSHYRDIVNKIDSERRELSTTLCRQIIADGGYEGLDPEDIAFTLEGLYDGFWLNILMYPGKFSRHDAMRRVETYLAQNFPDHFKHSQAPDAANRKRSKP
ncbi:TetR family transcriptional regulator C-terminal domain-containing protein [Aliiroseovarius subalbicans]|uniref:TetR family transcriptional regulator C-terminal domain-containing protein n=1 Tax=Aliiroseovarius subalbicans TaxID=2925840 RepID=UPI001F58015E|nr:TetR family transcriptional regulator C-terminal domain-containing protein [Aliiroseovarius subalbicans]MCI2397860.1 TetR family transcriptional regulator C-terminal domain-containing protein [Aliiroseovarius subalbicans]